MPKVIGGEMEFDLANLRLPKVRDISGLGTYCSSGRAALYTILQALAKRGINCILLPDYLCSSVVTTVAAAGMKYAFYSLSDKLLPDIDSIKVKIVDTSAVLVINYFGLQNLSGIVSDIKSLPSAPMVILDDVQAFFEFINPDSTAADYSFTSLRKWFPVPDGGFAHSKYGDLNSPETVDSFWPKKLCGLTLKELRDELGDIDSIYLQLLAQGEEMIDASLAERGSMITLDILQRISFDVIVSARRRNAGAIISGLDATSVKPLLTPAPEAVPFFIPVKLDNRDEIRRRLFTDRIFCPVHWPAYGLELRRGGFMAEHELSLIVDQRYDTDDMKRIIEVLSKS